DRATLKPRAERVGDRIADVTLSPHGKRAILEARGDLFSVPAEHGPVMDLTRTSGVAERSPAWSPDGKWVAYCTDRSGEYELAVRPADGSGAERQLTHFGPGFRYVPQWSPDSKIIAYVDQAMNIGLVEVSSGKLMPIDKGMF